VTVAAVLTVWLATRCRYGLDISYTDLQRVLGPYMKADPGRSIQLGELQDFLDNAYVPGMESFDASSVSAKVGSVLCWSA
jgi:hypothetical protein